MNFRETAHAQNFVERYLKYIGGSHAEVDQRKLRKKIDDWMKFWLQGKGMRTDDVSLSMHFGGEKKDRREYARTASAGERIGNLESFIPVTALGKGEKPGVESLGTI